MRDEVQVNVKRPTPNIGTLVAKKFFNGYTLNRIFEEVISDVKPEPCLGFDRCGISIFKPTTMSISSQPLSKHFLKKIRILLITQFNRKYSKCLVREQDLNTPPVEVSWLKRDVLLFAASIGCTVDELHFGFELHPNFAVFPTYPVILPFKKTTQEVIDFYASQAVTPIPDIPKFDYTRVVDGQRQMTFLKPLPVTSAGRKFEVRSKVIGVYDKGKAGSVLETEQSVVDAGTGEIYTKLLGSAFFVGQGNWGGPKGPATKNFPPPEGKKPDAIVSHQTTKESALLYRLNGDYNPLHATPEPGQNMGFGGAIMHGLSSFNFAAHGLLKALGGSDPKNIKEFQARFASPVKPGDKLVTDIWRTGEMKDGWEEIRFVTKVEGGKVALSNGRALMKVVAGGCYFWVMIQGIYQRRTKPTNEFEFRDFGLFKSISHIQIIKRHEEASARDAKRELKRFFSTHDSFHFQDIVVDLSLYYSIMKSFSLIAALSSIIALTSAAAIASPVEKRADVSVYLCNDRDFTGYCVDIKSPSGTCVPLGNDLNNQISSVGPDGSAICYFFVIMPEDIPSGSEVSISRFGTPDERWSYTISSNPTTSAPKFDVDATAYLKVLRKGSFHVTIVAEQNDAGKFVDVHISVRPPGSEYLSTGAPSLRFPNTPLRRCKIRALEDRHRRYRFLDSDDNSMIYRRFGYLHSRILIRKQELQQLEMELDKINDLDSGHGRLMCMNFTRPTNGETSLLPCVVLTFTLIFSAALSLLTKAKRHEIFGAAAAYCATLVVFIKNIPKVQIELKALEILAKEFNRNVLARDSDFTTSPTAPPTIAQFGCSSPLELSRATTLIVPHVNGVDINCGCPQSWACAESLGAALMEKRELVAEMVRSAKGAIKESGFEGKKTVSVKIRVHRDLRETVDFIKTVESAGIDFLTIHGRLKSTPSSTPVDLSAIKLLASHCTVPVLSNGDIFTLCDTFSHASLTGVDGVMSARDFSSSSSNTTSPPNRNSASSLGTLTNNALNNPNTTLAFGKNTSSALSHLNTTEPASRNTATISTLNNTFTLSLLSISSFCAPSPSWLTLGASASILYCADENTLNPNSSSLSAFKIAKNGTLTEMGKVILPGGSVYAEVFGDGNMVAVAEYGAGAVTILSTADSKNITKLQNIAWTNSMSGVSHPHQALLDPTSQHMIVPDLGSDLLRIFNIDNSTHSETPLVKYENIPLPPGSGPRHAVFYVPDCGMNMSNITTTAGTNNTTMNMGKTYLYLITETSSQIFGYEVEYVEGDLGLRKMWDKSLGTDGVDTAGNRVKTGMTGAEIVISPDNKFLIASTRNDSLSSVLGPSSSSNSTSSSIHSDSLLTYSLCPHTGDILFVQRAAAGGMLPRSFALNRAGDKVAVGLYGEGKVAVLDREVGILRSPSQAASMSPGFATLSILRSASHDTLMCVSIWWQVTMSNMASENRSFISIGLLELDVLSACNFGDDSRPWQIVWLDVDGRDMAVWNSFGECHGDSAGASPTPRSALHNHERSRKTLESLGFIPDSCMATLDTRRVETVDEDAQGSFALLKLAALGQNKHSRKIVLAEYNLVDETTPE
ncbi:hypothetical protein B7494_g2872 [Chlorociboria aeruginascens]|nr:hypothetical protein B7494_g2872 [Chlorociboria aeruginascens]